VFTLLQGKQGYWHTSHALLMISPILKG